MKTSCLRLKLVELNFLVSFNTDDQSKSDIANTAKHYYKHEMFEDVKLIDDELTKNNKSWCDQYTLIRIIRNAFLILLRKRMKAILIWLKEWSCLDKRNLCYLIYMKNSKT